MPEYLTLPGDAIGPEKLTVPKARELATFLVAKINPWAAFVGAIRQPDQEEAVITDLNVQVGQEPVHNILSTERVAIIFPRDDQHAPPIVSLRHDFPQVPHLNPSTTEYPRHLCVFAEPYPEVRLRWTPARIVERIRQWLCDTARGTLHREDQPLEPLLLPGPHYLITPPDLFQRDDDAPGRLLVIPRSSSGAMETLVARRPSEVSEEERRYCLHFVATTLRSAPLEHGILRQLPTTLRGLHDMMATAGLDLIGHLRTQLLSWTRADAPLDALLVILGCFPKTRTTGGTVEAADTWAFVTLEAIRTIGVALGAWEIIGGCAGTLLGAPPKDELLDQIRIDVLNPTPALTRPLAARLNGRTPSEAAVTAIGIGALGSQLIPILIKSGYGKWQFVDEDILLPHNVARHALPHAAVGFPKVIAFNSVCNQILDETVATSPIVADIFAPGKDKEELTKAFADAEIIADFSASVSVARQLALDVQGPGRRISGFLNPAGSDLVLLAEDSARTIRLDCLEMQYYRALIDRDDLAGHLRTATLDRVRYARSCRDLTSTIPEDYVALHAAIGARAFREAASSEAAAIRLWTASPALTVTSHRIDPSPVFEQQLGDWRLCTDQELINTLSSFRASRLPNETGGVLLGSIDTQRHIVYVLATVASPPDSRERPTLYIRGIDGLAGRLQTVLDRTADMVEYVGEWHTHPAACSTRPSEYDLQLFASLTEHMNRDGLPALMAIVGDDGPSWYLGQITQGESSRL
jgi:integrative and conjugative element protein (TIGR02256 family)